MRRKLVGIRCRQVLLVILGLCIALAIGTPALADSRYEYYTSGQDKAVTVFGSRWCAQTFTPSVAHTVTSVKLRLSRLGTPGTVTVGIRATSGLVPTGTDLCSGTIDGNTLTATYPPNAWHKITLGSGYSLSAGTTYAIVIRAPSGNSSNRVYWGIDSTLSVYAGGNQALSTDSGTTWSANSPDAGDMLFEEWGPACVATSTGTGTACFSSSAGAITGLSAVAEGSLPPAAQATKPIDFPDGLFSFNITGLSNGQTVTVNITLPSGAAPTQYWKYHVNEGGWVQIPMIVVGPPNVISITLQDGGLGDDDGAANGVIVDQGGPGSPAVGAVGWETHPVSKVRVLLPWIALAVVLAGGAGWYVRRRRTAQS